MDVLRVLVDFLIVAGKTLALLIIGQIVIFQFVTKGVSLVQRCLVAAFYARPQLSHLKSITPDLVSAPDQHGPTVPAARDQVWDTHADRFLERLDAAFAHAIGVETLTPGQSQHLRAAFAARVPDERADPAAHAVFARRYEANDDTLIDAFVQEYVAGEWVLQLRKDLNHATGGHIAAPSAGAAAARRRRSTPGRPRRSCRVLSARVRR